MDRNNHITKAINKNTKLQHTAHAHQPPTNSHIPQAQQGRAIQNKKQHLPLNEYIEEFYQEKVSRTDHEQKKDKTKRANGLGRRTREELKKKEEKKWNQLTDLRFQTKGRHRTFQASNPTTMDRKQMTTSTEY